MSDLWQYRLERSSLNQPSPQTTPDWVFCHLFLEKSLSQFRQNKSVLSGKISWFISPGPQIQSKASLKFDFLILAYESFDDCNGHITDDMPASTPILCHLLFKACLWERFTTALVNLFRRFLGKTKQMFTYFQHL